MAQTSRNRRNYAPLAEILSTEFCGGFAPDGKVVLQTMYSSPRERI